MKFLFNYFDGTHSLAFNNVFTNYNKWKNIIDEKELRNEIEITLCGDVATFCIVHNDENINWDSLKIAFEKQYPTFGKAAVLKSKPETHLRSEKPNYYAWVNEWKKVIQEIPDKITNEDLNSLAAGILGKIKDKIILNEALEWSRKSFEKEENSQYIDTYANLLYKLGRKKEAIEYEKKAISLLVDEAERKSYLETLEKMKEGKKTWK